MHMVEAPELIRWEKEGLKKVGFCGNIRSIGNTLWMLWEKLSACKLQSTEKYWRNLARALKKSTNTYTLMIRENLEAALLRREMNTLETGNLDKILLDVFARKFEKELRLHDKKIEKINTDLKQLQQEKTTPPQKKKLRFVTSAWKKWKKKEDSLNLEITQQIKKRADWQTSRKTYAWMLRDMRQKAGSFDGALNGHLVAYQSESVRQLLFEI